MRLECKLLTFLMFLCTLAKAQEGLYYYKEQLADDPFDDLTYYYVGGSAMNNNVFLGRRAEQTLPYLGAHAGIQSHTGFYAQIAAFYAPSSHAGQFDLLQLEAGYDRCFYNYKLLTGAYFNFNSYNANSPSIMGSIQQSFSLYMLWRGEAVRPQLTFTSLQSNGSDAIITLSLDHLFRLRDNNVHFFPGIAFNFGTQFYYDSYLKNKYKRTFTSVAPTAFITDIGAQKPLEIAFNAPILLRTKSCQFNIEPSYIVPLSTSKYRWDKGILTESVGSSIVLNISATYRYERK